MASSNNYDSEDEPNIEFDKVVLAPVRLTNVSLSLMSSDGDSKSSFTVDDMLEVEQLKREELHKQQRYEEVICIDDNDTSESLEEELMEHDGNGEEEKPIEHSDPEDEQEGGALHEPSPPLYNFYVSGLVDRRSQRLGVHEQVATVQLRSNEEASPHVHYNLVEQLALAITRAINNLLERHPDQLDNRDKLYFTINSSFLRNAYEGWGSTVGEWNSPNFEYRINQVFENLARMLNSNESFEVNDSFALSLVVVRSTPRGCGKKKYSPGKTTASQLKIKKRFIVAIPPGGAENLCCAQALLLTFKKATLSQDEFANKYNKGRFLQKRSYQTFCCEARALQRQAGIPVGTPCGGNELKEFARVLPDYTIIVIDADRCYEAYKYGEGSTVLALLLEKNHYDAITKLPSLWKGSYWCWHCLRKYDHKGRHACEVNKDHCSRCRQNGCTDFLYDRKHNDLSKHLSCLHCRRTFYGGRCFAHHTIYTIGNQPLAPDFSNTVCKMVYCCKTCGKLVNLANRDEYHGHRCYHACCPSCKEYVDLREHKCFIQTYDQKQGRIYEKAREKEAQRSQAENRPRRDVPPQKFSYEDDEDENLYVYFDIETMHAEDNRHIPNLVAATRHDSDTMYHWYGTDCIARFCDQLLTWSSEWTDEDTTGKVVVLAHNFQGYDSYPIVDYYHEQCLDLHQVRQGGKILELTVGGRKGNIRFIDSMSFLPMPLYRFTKTFGLNEQDLGLEKGFFPHFFNTPAHQDYEGPLPAKHYYGPHTMFRDRLGDFEKWYDPLSQQQPPYLFHLQNELLEYCISDVRLLKAGCEAFRSEFHSMTHFSPFNHMTIASACSQDLRRNRLSQNLLASEPVTGWRMATKHSHAAIEWLTYQEHVLGYSLQHARNRGEFPIPDGRHTYWLDGYDHENRTAYEFYGCFWHGCPKCYPQRTEPHQPLYGRNMSDVYTATCHRAKRLRSLGFIVIEMWECQWTAQKNSNPQIAPIIQHLVSPLHPREAFFGGRTNAVTLYATATHEQHIAYYDYTSLYPWVNKNKEYPEGHPDIQYNPADQNIQHYFGLAKCTVLPPSHLFHPVLPYRCSDKLTFPLCRTCAEKGVTKPLHDREWHCQHSPEQRQITGTWCTPELIEAVENQGYRLIRIHEVWQFRPCREVFKKYVNTWLKLKEEATGYPKGCDTPEQQQQHINDYLAREGIQLSRENIAKNPGKRAVAKLMLNSMWGKFGQRIDKTQVAEFTRAQDLQDFLASAKYDIRYVSPLTEDRVEVHFKFHDEMTDVSPNLNIFVACFTTCHARLKLLGDLNKLQQRALYYDTDSIIFRRDPNPDHDPELGSYLGDFKDELGEGEHITEFCSGGPKNYGYRTRKREWNPTTQQWDVTTKEVCKVRGFSLNVEGSEQLNYTVLKNHVLEEIGQGEEPTTTIIHERTKIVRNPKTYTLTTEPRDKLYRVVFNKRFLIPQDELGDPNDSYLSYPYGYFQSNI